MYWHFMSRIFCCLLAIPETLLRKSISDYQVVSYSLLHNLQIQNHIPVFECTVSHIGYYQNIQGVPKKMVILSGFEFLTLGGVFLGVKNNSKNSGNKKNIRLFSKILSKWTLFIKKMQKILCF